MSWWLPKANLLCECSVGAASIVGWVTAVPKGTTAAGSEWMSVELSWDHRSLSLFSLYKLCPTLRPRGLQHTRLPWPSLSPRTCSNSYLSSQWCHPTILSSVVPFSSCFSLSQHRALFQWVGSSHKVAKVLELQLQHQSFPWIFRVDCL